jgi:hypothetical protein
MVLNGVKPLALCLKQKTRRGRFGAQSALRLRRSPEICLGLAGKNFYHAADPSRRAAQAAIS